MDARINMIMVPAKNVDGLRAFYEEGLGWSPWMPASPMSVGYKVGSSILIFLDAAYLASESGIAAIGAPKALWAIFVEAKDEVESLFDRAIAASGTVTSAIRDRDGGLYSGYFADPEGNGWEIVWSPDMAPVADGSLTLAGQA